MHTELALAFMRVFDRPAKMLLLTAPINAVGNWNMTYLIAWLVSALIMFAVFHLVDMAGMDEEFPTPKIIKSQYICGLLALGMVWPIVLAAMAWSYLTGSAQLRTRWKRFRRLHPEAQRLGLDTQYRMVLKK